MHVMRGMRPVRPFSIFIALLFSLAIAGCGSAPGPDTGSQAQDADASEAQEQNSSTELSVGSWRMGLPTDDFGDVVEDGDPYIYQLFIGQFSNTATSGSDLSGQMIATRNLDSADEWLVMFSLHEYGDAAATYTSGDQMTLKTKTSTGTTREYILIGTPPNGMVGTVGTDFIEDLRREPDAVRCIIEIGSSRYEFSISSDGFDETIAEYEGVLSDKADVLKSHSDDEALRNIMPGNDFEVQWYAAQYLSEHVSEYEQLEISEVEALFPGTYAYIGFTVFDNGVSYDRLSDYLQIYIYGESTWNKLGNVRQNGEYFDSTLPKDYEYRKDGDIRLPEGYGYRACRIADGYYIVWNGRYIAEDGKSTGMVSGGLMFACDEKGNPLNPPKAAPTQASSYDGRSATIDFFTSYDTETIQEANNYFVQYTSSFKRLDDDDIEQMFPGTYAVRRIDFIDYTLVGRFEDGSVSWLNAVDSEGRLVTGSPMPEDDPYMIVNRHLVYLGSQLEVYEMAPGCYALRALSGNTWYYTIFAACDEKGNLTV